MGIAMYNEANSMIINRYIPGFLPNQTAQSGAANGGPPLLMALFLPTTPVIVPPLHANSKSSLGHFFARIDPLNERKRAIDFVLAHILTLPTPEDSCAAHNGLPNRHLAIGIADGKVPAAPDVAFLDAVVITGPPFASGLAITAEDGREAEFVRTKDAFKQQLQNCSAFFCCSQAVVCIVDLKLREIMRRSPDTSNPPRMANNSAD
ncbi:uncharacterized protein PITG_17064 [Phytophthora infestans T30-4]|uniref:Uncharacterized protein n=1 Tax=Phytophthora infestans (strain T30-4) TaxID=403677 RepID=D0NUY1_PHYIT|nr:uncharacterized protein PITG_17064 [Phytophthora infestans T30-4]EEY66453.1 hypothetical protein PITG_17064 [Phytophthora infestans T30-4]|eukprot:XP_002896972.1 hypothetical protein PITG_17064 [Phytophthora infestans T30-4]